MKKKLIDVTGPTKHVPQRTCIVCRQVKAKRELVRIVRTDTGVVVDTSGKKQGRGAYLCKAKECWESGLKGNRLEYVLHAVLTQQDHQQLGEYANKL
jgi:uncharacterized protein